MKNIVVKRINTDTYKKFIDKEALINDKLDRYDIDDLLYYNKKYEQHTTRYGIYLNKKMIGYAGVFKTQLSHLDTFYISLDFRRKGIGKYTLKHLNIFTVFVQDINTPAIHFYESCGFKNIGIEKGIISYYLELKELS